MTQPNRRLVDGWIKQPTFLQTPSHTCCLQTKSHMYPFYFVWARVKTHHSQTWLLFTVCSAGEATCTIALQDTDSLTLKEVEILNRCAMEKYYLGNLSKRKKWITLLLLLFDGPGKNRQESRGTDWGNDMLLRLSWSGVQPVITTSDYASVGCALTTSTPTIRVICHW